MILGRQRAFALRLAVLAATALASAPAAARAEGDSSQPSAPVAVVCLVDLPADSGSELAALLAELLGRRQIRATVSTEARFDPAQWMDAGPRGALLLYVVRDREDRVRFYFRAPAGERFLLRELPLPHGVDAVGREMIGQVVASSVAALLQSDAAGLDRAQAQAELARQQAPVSPSVDRAPPSAAKRWTGLFELRYDLAWSGTALGALDGPALEVGLLRLVSAVAQPNGVRLGLAASAGWTFPQRLATSALDSEIDAVGARLLLLLEWRPGRYQSVMAAAGGGADLRRARTTAVHDPAITPSSESRHVDPNARVEVGYGLGGGPWRVALHLFADAALDRVDYAVATSRGAVTVAVPWQVRPGMSLSLAFTPSF